MTYRQSIGPYSERWNGKGRFTIPPTPDGWQDQRNMSHQPQKLLTRDEFREAVFARDKKLCVLCKGPGVDAHHIMERRLFSDGGYYLDNGATLCPGHHLEAESTEISCEEIRTAAKITQVILPEHLYPDVKYDKWGNPFSWFGGRMRGELFHDESVQKALKPVLHQFTKYVKYPRTYHLPWSPGATEDDRVMKDTSYLEGKRVIITVKLDGENTTLYDDHLHVRSIDSSSDATRHWVQNFHAKIAHEIPESWRICGENLYAKHQIHYHNLTAYFQVFGIWENQICLSWDDTMEYATLLNIPMVPLLYDGPFHEHMLKTATCLYHDTFRADPKEGFVVRLADAFPARDYQKAVGKYVRAGFTPGSHDYRRSQIVRNELKCYRNTDEKSEPSSFSTKSTAGTGDKS